MNKIEEIKEKYRNIHKSRMERDGEITTDLAFILIEIASDLNELRPYVELAELIQKCRVKQVQIYNEMQTRLVIPTMIGEEICNKLLELDK